MANFNPQVEAQAIVKIGEAYDKALQSYGGNDVARSLMSEVQDEWCKLSRKDPKAAELTLDAIEQIKHPASWSRVTDGDGNLLGILETAGSYGVQAYLPLKCRM